MSGIAANLEQALASVTAARQTRLADLAGVEIAQVCKLTQAVIAAAQALALDATVAADTAHVAKREGAASTQAFIAKTMGVSLRDAAKELKLAKDLHRAAPQTREALSLPGMSKDKAAVIARAMDNLPTSVTVEQRATIEADLVTKAQVISVEDLRRAAKRSLEVINTDWADEVEGATLAREEKVARRRSEFWMGAPNDAGMVEGGFKIPVLHAAILKTTLEAFTSPRQDQYLDVAETDATYPQKLGRGFCQMLERLPADRFPQHGGMPATIVVNADYDQLISGIGAATIGSTGDRISITEVRRIACEARIMAQVLTGESVTLDLGRDERLHNRGHRTSLAAKYKGCAFPDCAAPAAWCDIHHPLWWSHGGETKLKDGIPLCHAHHVLIHDEDWTVRIAADGWAEFTPPTWIDKQQRPRRNTHWHAHRKQAS